MRRLSEEAENHRMQSFFCAEEDATKRLLQHTTKHRDVFQVRKPKGWNRFNGNRNDYRDFREKVSVQAFSFGSRKACSRVVHEQFSVTGLEVNCIEDKQRQGR